MRGANRGDAARMRSCRQPIEEFGPDRPAPLAASAATLCGARFAGDQQDQPRALRQCQSEPVVEPDMSGVERMAVEVDSEVRLDETMRQLAIPTGVERVGPAAEILLGSPLRRSRRSGR